MSSEKDSPQRGAVEVRRAVAGDAPAIAEAHVSSWKAAYKGLLPQDYLDGLSAERALAGSRRRIDRPDMQTLVCRMQGRVVGFVSFGASGDADTDKSVTGQIIAIYLLPDWWGRGGGTALCRAALRQLREEGFREAILWVLRGNDMAMGFYQAMGFALDGRERSEVNRDGIELHELRMRRTLAGC